MIDIVIPLGTGSKWHNNELRYSLRSLEKFGRGIRHVFIVGDCPEWINIKPYRHEGVIVNSNFAFHIPATDKHGHERNIMEKLLIACNDSRVSENFIAWQDDYFLTEETDLENYPYYYSGTIQEKIATRIPNDGYRKSMENTLNAICANHIAPLFFDIHCPIIYNKEKFKQLANLNWNIGNGYVIKSLYGWHFAVPRKEMSELKFSSSIGLAEIKQKLQWRHIFSISDGVMMCPTKTMRMFLEESYSEKSKYEK